ncbi:MAG TPA: arginine--tRNA ligase [Candidatus Saccharimonadales bacterium]|nr:arginine--tRNA ligase [Candidatus Saccharimonadales bacterium]
MLRDQIKKDIFSAIKAKKVDISEDQIEVARTADPKFGDFSTNIALKVNRDQLPETSKGKQSPQETAKLLTDSLKDCAYVEKLEVAGPGFINFFIKPEVWQTEVESVLNSSSVIASIAKQSQTILVEYAHPNTHKLFHIGHLRNITTGETIARLLEAVGNKVTRVNYQGDVGLHIAKAIWGLQNLGTKEPKTLDQKIELLAQAYKAGNQAYEEGGQKEAIELINKKIYEKDAEIMKVWEQTRGWSLEYFDRIYSRVGTKFDRLYFESEVADSGKKEVLRGQNEGIFEKSEGAVVFAGDKYGLHKRVFINSLGFPTYEGKDMGLAKLQFSEYSPDLIIHTVAPEQTDYFKVIFKAMEFLLPQTKGKELHLAYGWVRLKEGKMSSRKGEVITGEWLLDEAKNKIKEQFVDVGDDVAEQVAVGAVKYSFLKMSLGQDLVFDINEAVNLNGNSGPYLQYTHARCVSVLAKNHGIVKPNNLDSMLPEENALLGALGHFEEVVLDAAVSYSPNLVANFLFDVAQKFNGFYNKLPILKAAEPEQAKRLFLTRATADVLKKGLYLLGIFAPEKM